MTAEQALVEYVNANPGCSLRAINFALSREFPAVHFETLIEVKGAKLLRKVNVVVPKTEGIPQRLVTLYFPVGSMIGLS